jgi:hypothetical protein
MIRVHEAARHATRRRTWIRPQSRPFPVHEAAVRAFIAHVVCPTQECSDTLHNLGRREGSSRRPQAIVGGGLAGIRIRRACSALRYCFWPCDGQCLRGRNSSATSRGAAGLKRSSSTCISYILESISDNTGMYIDCILLWIAGKCILRSGRSFLSPSFIIQSPLSFVIYFVS